MKNPGRLLLLRILKTILFAQLSYLRAASVSTSALADAFVATGPNSNFRDNNYGGGGALAVAAPGLPNGEFQSVIKFDLSSARNSLDAQFGPGAWSVQSASLQLSASPHSNAIYNDVAAGAFSISLMQNNSWVEGAGTASAPAANGITYNTLQNTFINNAADEALGTFAFLGNTGGTDSYSLTLSPGLNSAIGAGDTVTLRLFGADNNVSYLFSSRAASTSSSRPQLVVVAVPEPGVWALLVFGLLLCLGCRPLKLVRAH